MPVGLFLPEISKQNRPSVMPEIVIVGSAHPTVSWLVSSKTYPHNKRKDEIPPPET